MGATKSICFKCHFVGIGLSALRCPSCAFPLIQDTGAVALGVHDLERYFRKAPPLQAPPLPGVNPEKRTAQLLMERRKQRAERLMQMRKRAARRDARRRAMGRMFAASMFLAGLFGALGFMGAL
jgi:hypothetical protein